MTKTPMKEIRILPALNGWTVRIGCATVVAVSKEGMLSEIGRYIDDPGAVEKEYAANAVNQGTYTPDGGESPRSEPTRENSCDQTGPSLDPGEDVMPQCDSG